MNILMVDDTATIRTLMATMLKRFGHQVATAKDGIDAWSKLQEASFDLLITDWNMSQMNGLQLVEKVRADDTFAALPIIMITTRGNKEDIVAAIKAGVDNYATKPVTPEDLQDKIAKACKKRSSENTE